MTGQLSLTTIALLCYRQRSKKRYAESSVLIRALTEVWTNGRIDDSFLLLLHLVNDISRSSIQAAL